MMLSRQLLWGSSSSGMLQDDDISCLVDVGASCTLMQIGSMLRIITASLARSVGISRVQWFI